MPGEWPGLLSLDSTPVAFARLFKTAMYTERAKMSERTAKVKSKFQMMMLDTNCTWARLKLGRPPRHGDGRASSLLKHSSQTKKGHQLLLLSPPHLPALLPSDCLHSNLLIFPVNWLSSSRQSKARNAIRLSMFVVASHSGSYLLQIPHYGSSTLHRKKKKTGNSFPQPH